MSSFHSQQPQFVYYSLPDGSHVQLSTMKHPDSSKPAVACDLCGKLIEITASGSLAYFSQHRGSKSCKKKERARGNAVMVSETRMILQTMVHLVFTNLLVFYFNIFGYFEMPTTEVSDLSVSTLPPSQAPDSPLQNSNSARFSSPGHIPIIDELEDSNNVLLVSGSDFSVADSESMYPTPNIDSDPLACTGVLVEWTAGSVWDTYPYHQHGIRKHLWEPIGFEGNDSWLRLRSKDCCIVLLHEEMNRLCCRKCAAIPSSSEFRKFVGRATNTAEHTPYFYLTQRQLHSLLVKVTTKYRELSLKVLCYILF